MFVRERFKSSDRIFWVLKSDWFLEGDVDVGTLFVVEIDCIVYTYYVEESEVISDVRRRLDDVIERKLKRVDIVLVSELGLTLTD